MNDKIRQFLKNEKEISEFKVELLKNGKNRSYKDRLIKLEKEFICFPFEELSFASLDDAREAVTLFKVDRPAFNKKNNILSEDLFDKDNALSVLSKKLSFYEDKCKWIIESEIQEAVDGGPFFNDAKSKIEARYKVLACSFARNIYTEIKRIKKDVSKDSDKETLQRAKISLDLILNYAQLNIFKYYNSSIEHSCLLSENTFGQNKYISSVYPLSNLINNYPGNLRLERVLDKEIDFFNEDGSVVDKNYIKRGLSIVTPMNRIGNEKVQLLYREVFSDKGHRLDAILKRDFYNCKVGENYFKAVATVPLWEMIDHKDSAFVRDVKRSVDVPSDLSFSELSKEQLHRLNLADFSANIDKDKSLFLIASTRSELEKINKAKNKIDLLIKNLKEEYSNIFYSFKAAKGDSSRLIQIKSILGSISDEWN